MTKSLAFIFGTEDPVLGIRIMVVLLVALLGALAGVLLLQLPIWTFGILAFGLLVTFRIGVPLGLFIAHTTQAQEGGNNDSLSDITEEEVNSVAREVRGKLVDAKKDPDLWVRHADELYLASRFLVWKGFPKGAALLGAQAMELYFKAYLIKKTGKYRPGHGLREIAKRCAKEDAFFKDKVLDDPNFAECPTWTTYLEFFRYPEPLPGKGYPHASATGHGHFELLDRIARFVRDAVPQSYNRDIIAQLIDGREDYYRWAISNNFSEIRQLFLLDNHHFGT